MIYTIRNEVLSLSVDTEGGSMVSLNYRGEERLWQGGAAWKSRDVVIFPIVGHAGEYEAEGATFAPMSHGVARYSSFRFLEKSADKIILGFTDSEQTKKTYPYSFDFEICYKLIANCVQVTYTVRSKSGKIPFYVGGHPGLVAPKGEAIIEFENEEQPVMYQLGTGEGASIGKLKRFVANKDFFKQCKTLQLGNLSGGKIFAKTVDGFTYAFKSNCPVFAFWSNEDGGEYICVEPWWGINDYDGAPKELSKKPFINFADEDGNSFSYTLTIDKD